FPRSQFQNLGLPVDWSWKFTTSGAQPEVTLEMKLATGVCACVASDKNKAVATTMYVHTCLAPGNGVFHFFPACVSRGRVSLFIKQSGFVIRYAIIYLMRATFPL